MNTTMDTALIIISLAFLLRIGLLFARTGGHYFFLSCSGSPARSRTLFALANFSAKGSRPSFPFNTFVGTMTDAVKWASLGDFMLLLVSMNVEFISFQSNTTRIAGLYRMIPKHRFESQTTNRGEQVQKGPG